MKSIVLFVASVSLCIAVPIALYIGVRMISVFSPAPPEPSHSELVTTLLAGLTISIAVLAIVVAGLAIWGYQTITGEARNIALKVAQTSAIKHLKGEDAQSKLRNEARTIIEEEFAKFREGLDLGASQPRQEASIVREGDNSEKVGKPRPRKRKRDDSGD